MCMGKYECGNVKTRKGMKPRTKLQREVLAMADRLPSLTEAKVRWARDRFEHVAYYWKLSGHTWCQECGHIWRQSAPELYVSIKGECRCPNCGRELRMAHYIAGHIERGERLDEKLFAVVTSRGEWTVVRVFMAQRFNRLGMPGDSKATRYYEWEVWQDWIRDDGREVITTKTYHRSPYYFRWTFGSDWGIGTHNGGYSGYFVTQDVYDLEGVDIYPVMRPSAIMRRNGFSDVLVQMTGRGDYLIDLMKGLLTIPVMEWLAKVGQYGVLAHELRTQSHQCDVWYHALRICVRNGYYVSDPTVYFDYLGQLREFGKDTHSPRYVCPVDLFREHDRYTEKQTKKRIERMAKDSQKYEAGYRKRVGMFFGVCFGNDDIVVTVIGSVAEMAEEGTRMHHCVFANRYYAKKDTVILSAKTRGGGRLETVEVDTKRWCVVQSRGLCNNPTARHAEIVALVEDNMDKLQKCV